GVSAICRDMSEQVRLTREMETMNAELRRLSGELLRLQDLERRRIARELHDGAVQELAGIVINLRSLRDLGMFRGSVDARRLVDHSIQMADECSRGLRTLSYVLHPPMLDELGLATALTNFVDGFSQRTGIEVRLGLPAEMGRFAADLELAIFRI